MLLLLRNRCQLRGFGRNDKKGRYLVWRLEESGVGQASLKTEGGASAPNWVSLLANICYLYTETSYPKA